MESHCAPVKNPKSDRNMKQSFTQPLRMNEFITLVLCAFCQRQYYQVGNDSVARVAADTAALFGGKKSYYRFV